MILGNTYMAQIRGFFFDMFTAIIWIWFLDWFPFWSWELSYNFTHFSFFQFLAFLLWWIVACCKTWLIGWSSCWFTLSFIRLIGVIFLLFPIINFVFWLNFWFFFVFLLLTFNYNLYNCCKLQPVRTALCPFPKNVFECIPLAKHRLSPFPFWQHFLFRQVWLWLVQDFAAESDFSNLSLTRQK